MSTLIEAIAKTAGAILPLAKTQFNPHAKYSYVGIDDFYALVAPIARANGLIWTISETAPPDILPGDKHPILVFHFEVALHCAAPDKEHGTNAESISMRISIPHGWQGAQTAGSASSYAIKTILRAVFAVQTGETDADATEQTSFAPRSPSGVAKGDPFAVTTAPVAVPVGAVASPPASTPPAVAPPPTAGGRDAEVSMGEMEPILKGWFEGSLPVLLDPKGDQSYPWELARDILKENVRYVTPADKVSAWWRENIAVMDQMKENDPDSHKAVVKAFEDRRHQLIKESKEKQK